MNRWLFLIISSMCLCCNSPNVQMNSQEMRLITLGGTVSEITSALGCQHKIVGRDVTSNYPTSLDSIKSLGHKSQIKLESILSLNPTQIILEKGFLSDEMLKTLNNQYGISITSVENTYSLASTRSMIITIGVELNKESKALELVNSIDVSSPKAKHNAHKPNVLFIYARGSGSMQVAGNGTFAHSLIELSGGKNAAVELEGFKPLTTEALIKLNPDYLLFFTSGYESLGGQKGIAKLAGVSETNAGKKHAFIHNDASLLGNFGPRITHAIEWLEEQIQ